MEVENNQEQELLQKHQRDINCLIEDDRNLRKRGLTNISKGFFDKKLKQDVIIKVFQQNLAKNLMRTFEDKIEKNREMSYQIIEKLIEILPGNEKLIDRDLIINLIRVFCARLNQIPFPEQSEEIRLQIIEILRKMLKLFPEEFLPILQDVALTISKALQDQFPNLKKQTAQFIMEISDILDKHIGHHNISIVKSLGQNLKHQHSRVRKITIQALVSILTTQNGGAAIEHIFQQLSNIIFDANNEVRKTSFEGIAKLMTDFSIGNLKQYETKLLQLLLNGLSDEVPEIQAYTQNILEDIGLKRKVLSLEVGENIEEFV